LIEKVKNQTLKDAMFQIMTIAGMRETTYNPTTSKDQIVPGGYNKGVCQGVPYNQYAHFINNMAGNAGLFSTIDNMANYMQLMLNKGKLNLTKVFNEDIVTSYTTAPTKAKYNNTNARGWDTVPAVDSPCGKKFSKSSFGLADTSGSYVWADK
jgi:CubicO group peptidase (beta-lactamase class C family)